MTNREKEDKPMEYTLNCNGQLLDLSTPQVMGIVNVTPDSFYAASRVQSEREVSERVTQILAEGGTMIDVGACSTRPGSTPATEAEEEERLRWALAIVRREVPQAVVSVDTFRPDIARMAVEEFGVDIINDVGPNYHYQLSIIHSQLKNMFRMVSRLRVPYIYMSARSTMKDILLDCAEAVDTLRSMGQKDIVLDPGIGFGKTLEENYAVLRDLEHMKMMGLPVLVGLSRKSMIYRLLGSSPSEAGNGTTVLNTVALMKGASILRVHDVREAVECIRLVAPCSPQAINFK
ncbi:MAG: dihydropteroate synthase [Prevotella sp.]|nr:dihydropteroate synthase [Prevotella sp.]MBQ9187381.1 dihydropteroate synthase [Prevotella sp.]